jgi:ADP-heptose:LPS heptosyltransferase
MKILIPIYTGIGNAVLLTPMIRTIKKVYPDSQISLIGDNKWGANELFESDKDIHQIILKLDKFDYDVYFHPALGGKYNLPYILKLNKPFVKIIIHQNLFLPQKQLRNIFKKYVLRFKLIPVSSRHEIYNYLAMLSEININKSDFILNPTLSPYIISNGVSTFRKFNIENNFILIQPAAANNLKTPKKWPIVNWITLIKALQNKGERVVLCGYKDENEIADEICKKLPGTINVSGKTNITELVGFIASSKCVIAADSGIAHISSAMNKKSVVLWGPTSFTKNRPIGVNTIFVISNSACAPCTGGFGLLDEETSVLQCPYNLECMKRITPEHVFSYVSHLEATG